MIGVQLISCFIGSFCLGILFRLRGKKLAAASIGGFCSWGLFLLLHCGISSEPICYFLVSLIISFYAEIMARVLKTPATPIATTSLIPLIPGGSLYDTMAFAFASDFPIFMEKAASTLKLASALALGIIVVTALSQVVFRKKVQGRCMKS